MVTCSTVADTAPPTTRTSIDATGRIPHSAVPLLRADHGSLTVGPASGPQFLAPIVDPLFETDSGDLRAGTETKSGGVTVILSDTVAGGAGYCRRLVGDQRFGVSSVIIAATGEILDSSNTASVTSCSRCLNEYSNQRHRDDFERQPCLEWLQAFQR